jgi:DUF971 family protein
MFPLKINLIKENIVIDWESGNKTQYKLANLRKNCPCAICVSEKESRGDTYIPIYSGDQLKIEDIRVMGNYGLNVIWKDGHNTGIYEFEQLEKLMQVIK